MRSLLLSVSAATIAAALTLGCSGAVATDSAPAVTLATPATRAPLAQPTHGRAKRVAEALGQVALRADQRAQIEDLAKTAEATHAAAAAAQQDFAETLATQVTAGALDRDALAAKVSRVSAAWAAAQPTERASFESLHGILDAGQRAELVAAMKAAHGDDHPKDKEFEGHKGHGPGERWADALQLTDEQRTAFKSILHEAFASFHGAPGMGHEHHHGGHGELLEAFQGDTFSFDAVVPPHDVQAHVSEMSGHLMDVVEKVLPLLTAQQRTLAAQLIRDHADHLPLGER